MSRLAQLEARRTALIARCATQRRELAQQLAQLRPGPRAADGAAPHGRRRHPLAWLVILGGLALLGRTREVLSLVIFLRTAVSFAARAAQLLRRAGVGRAARTHGTP